MTNDGMLFDLYINELIAWNKKFNLTAITDPEEIRIKHFADSLSLLNTMGLTIPMFRSHRKSGSRSSEASIGTQSVIDIGAGAGFPGLPLKIKYPNIRLTLVEATRKKTEFLKHIVDVYKLKDVEVIWGRAEDVIQGRRESFDLAVARAVAQLNVLAEYCLPFVKVGGQFVAYKNENVEAEVAEAERAIKTLGGRLKEVKKVKLENSEIVHSLVIIDKIFPTPREYPRQPGIAKKKPL